MTNTIFLSMPLAEFQANQRELIKQVLQEFQLEKSPQSNENKETYATRKEVSKALHVSLPTLNELTKKGTIKGYRIGGRVLYKWVEVETSLTEIQSLKYSRA